MKKEQMFAVTEVDVQENEVVTVAICNNNKEFTDYLMEQFSLPPEDTVKIMVAGYGLLTSDDDNLTYRLATDEEIENDLVYYAIEKHEIVDRRLKK